MVPSDRRLLRSACSGLRRAAAQADPSLARTLAATNVLLDELALRADVDWFAAYEARARALISEGQTLVSSDLAQRTTAVGGAEILKGTLTQLVLQLAPEESRSRAVKDYLGRVVDWENELYARRTVKTIETVDPLGPAAAFTADAIERYLSAKFPGRSKWRASNVRVVGGGFSKTTVMVDAQSEQDPGRTLVIRAETADSLLFYEGAQIDNEYRVLKLLQGAGISVAEPLWLERDVQPFGVRFLVSARGAGRNFGTAIHVNEPLSQALLHELMSNLYAIHQTKITADDEWVRGSHLARSIEYRSLSEATAQNVADWNHNIGRLELPASPIIARAVGWLASHIPPCDEAPCLVHRDYGLHNILVEDDRIACILDWENANLGDPAEDLAWTINSMSGTVDRQAILDAYAILRGSPVPEQRVRFFEVFNSLKYAVTCLHALTLFERNAAAPMSLCELGLQFMHHGTQRLNQHIALAEEAAAAAG